MVVLGHNVQNPRLGQPQLTGAALKALAQQVASAPAAKDGRQEFGWFRKEEHLRVPESCTPGWFQRDDGCISAIAAAVNYTPRQPTACKDESEPCLSAIAEALHRVENHQPSSELFADGTSNVVGDGAAKLSIELGSSQTAKAIATGNTSDLRLGAIAEALRKFEQHQPPAEPFEDVSRIVGGEGAGELFIGGPGSPSGSTHELDDPHGLHADVLFAWDSCDRARARGLRLSTGDDSCEDERALCMGNPVSLSETDRRLSDPLRHVPEPRGAEQDCGSGHCSEYGLSTDGCIYARDDDLTQTLAEGAGSRLVDPSLHSLSGGDPRPENLRILGGLLERSELPVSGLADVACIHMCLGKIACDTMEKEQAWAEEKPASVKLFGELPNSTEAVILHHEELPGLVYGYDTCVGPSTALDDLSDLYSTLPYVGHGDSTSCTGTECASKAQWGRLETPTPTIGDSLTESGPGCEAFDGRLPSAGKTECAAPKVDGQHCSDVHSDGGDAASNGGRRGRMASSSPDGGGRTMGSPSSWCDPHSKTPWAAADADHGRHDGDPGLARYDSDEDAAAGSCAGKTQPARIPEALPQGTNTKHDLFGCLPRDEIFLGFADVSPSGEIGAKHAVARSKSRETVPTPSDHLDEQSLRDRLLPSQDAPRLAEDSPRQAQDSIPFGRELPRLCQDFPRHSSDTLRIQDSLWHSTRSPQDSLRHSQDSPMHAQDSQWWSPRQCQDLLKQAQDLSQPSEDLLGWSQDSLPQAEERVLQGQGSLRVPQDPPRQGRTQLADHMLDDAIHSPPLCNEHGEVASYSHPRSNEFRQSAGQVASGDYNAQDVGPSRRSLSKLAANDAQEASSSHRQCRMPPQAARERAKHAAGYRSFDDFIAREGVHPRSVRTPSVQEKVLDTRTLSHMRDRGYRSFDDFLAQRAEPAKAPSGAKHRRPTASFVGRLEQWEASEQRRQKKIEAARAMIDQHEVAELTLKPELCPASMKMLNRRSRRTTADATVHPRAGADACGDACAVGPDSCAGSSPDRTRPPAAPSDSEAMRKPAGETTSKLPAATLSGVDGMHASERGPVPSSSASPRHRTGSRPECFFRSMGDQIARGASTGVCKLGRAEQALHATSALVPALDPMVLVGHGEEVEYNGLFKDVIVRARAGMPRRQWGLDGCQLR